MAKHAQNKKNFPILQVATDSLVPYANNSRTHTDKQVEQIAASIKEFGFTNPVIIDEQATIIAGHCRVRAANLLGLEHVPCVQVEGWTEAQKKAYVIADNKHALNSGWNEKLLAIELGELESMGFDLELTGFTEMELADFDFTTDDGSNTDDDELPEVPDKPVTIEGDIWQLGNHRIMCGDSTDAGAVALLMAGQKADMIFTEPPYGVSANGGRSCTVKKKNMTKIENDNLRDEELQKFIYSALNHRDMVKSGAAFYVCYDHKTQVEFGQAIRDLGWRYLDTIIWNKNVFGLSGFKGYRPKHEMILFGTVSDKITWYGGNDQGNVWDIPRPTERPGNHPTPKPVALVEKAMKNSSKKDDIVLDLFTGSGATVIAAAKTKRRCYGMELDPKYVDVIIKRWQEWSGDSAVHENGTTYEDMKIERGV